MEELVKVYKDYIKLLDEEKRLREKLRNINETNINS